MVVEQRPSFRKRIDVLTAEHEELQDHHQSLIQEANELREKLKVALDKAERCDKLQAEVKVLKEELASESSRCSELKASSKKLAAENESLKSKLDAASEAQKSAQDASAKLVARCEQLEAKLRDVGTGTSDMPFVPSLMALPAPAAPPATPAREGGGRGDKAGEDSDGHTTEADEEENAGSTKKSASPRKQIAEPETAIVAVASVPDPLGLDFLAEPSPTQLDAAAGATKGSDKDKKKRDEEGNDAKKESKRDNRSRSEGSRSASSYSSSSASKRSKSGDKRGKDKERSQSKDDRRRKGGRKERRKKRRRGDRDRSGSGGHKRGRRRRRRRRRREKERSESDRSASASYSDSRSRSRSRRGGQKRGGEAFGTGDHKQDLEKFISTNQLEARVAAALRSMPESEQKQVMGTDGGENSFCLEGRVKNPNAVVMSRVRKIEKQR